jgi:hypothetical protein
VLLLLPTLELMVMPMLGLPLLLLLLLPSAEPDPLKKPLDWGLLVMPMLGLLLLLLLRLPSAEPDRPLKKPLETSCQQRHCGRSATSLSQRVASILQPTYPRPLI